MFSGSFVAANFIKKGVAKPIARPVLTNAATNYKAFIIAKQGYEILCGDRRFQGERKVAYTLLASSGEAFVRSLLPAEKNPRRCIRPCRPRAI